MTDEIRNINLHNLKQVSDYTVTKVLGKGGFGTVSAVVDKDGQTFALKTVSESNNNQE
jgi:hypothetical protein